MKVTPLRTAISGIGVTDPLDLVSEDRLISHALHLLGLRMKKGPIFAQPQAVKDYLVLKIGALEYEIFGALFLDAQHQLIENREIFRGTLTQTSVYPREVAKMALQLNAASLIVYHNHPSGLLEPSRADELLTQTLKSALQLVDVRIIDHFVVGHQGALSFAERGLI